MNLLGMLTAAARSAPAKAPVTAKRKPNKNNIQRNADARYQRLLTGKAMTTGEIASAFDLTHMGCLSSLYRLEERGLIRRAGLQPSSGSRPTIRWTWVTPSTGA